MTTHYNELGAEISTLQEQFARNPNSVTPEGQNYLTNLIKQFQNRSNFSKLGSFNIAPDPGYNQFRLGGDNTPYTNILSQSYQYWQERGFEGGFQEFLGAVDRQTNFSGLQGGNTTNFNISTPQLSFDEQLQLTTAGQSGFQSLANSQTEAARINRLTVQDQLKAQQDLLKRAEEWEPGAFGKAFGATNPITGEELEGWVDIGLDVGGALYDIWGSMEDREETERANKASERLQEQQIATGIISGGQAVGALAAGRATRLGFGREGQEAARTRESQRYQDAFAPLGNRYVQTADA
jgi:hypothetical protein